MDCKFMKCFLRILFSIMLILIAIKGCQDINDNKGFVSQNLRLLSEKTSILGKLKDIRKYSGLIIVIENYLFIFSACLLLLGLKQAKLFGVFAILIELILVHNPIFYGEGVYRGVSSQYLAILGGILSF